MSVERTYFFGPWAPEQTAKLWGDGIHDDAVGLQWYLEHGNSFRAGSTHPLRIPHLMHDGGPFSLTAALVARRHSPTTA
jgi:hypothetical protein